MEFWETTDNGEKRFLHGRENYFAAAEAAAPCPLFVRDDEDETVCDDPKSCYNCRYRRWTADAFVCMKR